MPLNEFGSDPRWSKGHWRGHGLSVHGQGRDAGAGHFLPLLCSRMQVTHRKFVTLFMAKMATQTVHERLSESYSNESKMPRPRGTYFRGELVSLI